MINDYKLDPTKIYIYENKDDQYPAWHHPYMKDCGAGTGAEIVQQVEEFKRIIIKEAPVGSDCNRAVRLGSNLYFWNDEVKAFARKRQAQVRKQNGNTDTILTSHPAANTLMTELKEAGFKRAGKKDIRYGGSGTEFTLKKFYNTVTNYPQYTWAVELKVDVGIDREGGDLLKTTANIYIANTEGKTVAANRYQICRLQTDNRWYGYRDIGREAQEIINNYVEANFNGNKWQKEDELQNKVYEYLNSQHASFMHGDVFNRDFQNNFRNNDRLYYNFVDVDLSGKTATEMDQQIQGVINNADGMTTDPTEVIRNNERSNRLAVEKAREVIEEDQDYAFGESLEENKKDLTLEEMLENIED